MLRNANYLVFILVQLVLTGMMQFYFLGTGRFMQDAGISGKNIPAAMGIAQAAQALATLVLLGWFVEHVPFRWVFVIGRCAGRPCLRSTFGAADRGRSWPRKRSTAWPICFSSLAGRSLSARWRRSGFWRRRSR